MNLRDLAIIGYAQGFTLWVYRPPLVVEDVFEAGHLNDAADTVRPGDVIYVVGTDVTVQATVASAAPGKVTIERMGG